MKVEVVVSASVVVVVVFLVVARAVGRMVGRAVGRAVGRFCGRFCVEGRFCEAGRCPNGGRWPVGRCVGRCWNVGLFRDGAPPPLGARARTSGAASGLESRIFLSNKTELTQKRLHLAMPPKRKARKEGSERSSFLFYVSSFLNFELFSKLPKEEKCCMDETRCFKWIAKRSTHKIISADYQNAL